MATKQKRVDPHGTVQYVRVGTMSVPPHAQREIKQYKVDDILANFDLDVFGLPVVSFRRGIHYVLDGQHRIEAFKAFFGEEWPDLQIECRVYEGLSEKQEAEMFLRLNNSLTVSTFDKFRIGVNAGRDVESSIKKILDKEGLRVSRDKIPGAIGAVGTLRKVYTRSNAATFTKSLRIIRDAFGDAGFEALIIDGLGHLCQRYDGLLEENLAVKQLSNVHGGVKGLLNRAETLHKQTGSAKSHCVAAASVEIINRGARGKQKLASWWKHE
jgi:hypothetical protein